jgi:hypothetical protein
MLEEPDAPWGEAAEVARQTRQSSTKDIARMSFCCAMPILGGGAMIGDVPARPAHAEPGPMQAGPIEPP